MSILIYINKTTLITIKMNNGLIGIANIGNTCYMNSIIQCISNCTPFRNYLLDKQFVDCLAYNINEKYKLNDESLIISWH